MSHQHAIDFDAARLARDTAIQRAIDHADRVEPKWSEQAYAFLDRYLRTHAQLTSEDVRDAAAGEVPEPPNLRAWGGVFQRAARAGAIQRAGYDTARDPRVHCNVVTVWKSLLYVQPNNQGEPK